MSPSLPLLSGAEIVRILGKAGFQRVSQRGSHTKLRDRSGRTVIVPMHDELARGTLRSILRQADLSSDEFAQLRRGTGRPAPFRRKAEPVDTVAA